MPELINNKKITNKWLILPCLFLFFLFSVTFLHSLVLSYTKVIAGTVAQLDKRDNSNVICKSAKLSTNFFC